MWRMRKQSIPGPIHLQCGLGSRLMACLLTRAHRKIQTKTHKPNFYPHFKYKMRKGNPKSTRIHLRVPDFRGGGGGGGGGGACPQTNLIFPPLQNHVWHPGREFLFYKKLRRYQEHDVCTSWAQLAYVTRCIYLASCEALPIPLFRLSVIVSIYLKSFFESSWFNEYCLKGMWHLRLQHCPLVCCRRFNAVKRSWSRALQS